jgi:hypothetical protein
MPQAELLPTSVSQFDGAIEVVIVKRIVAYPHIGTVLDEMYPDNTIIDSPLDMVGNIIAAPSIAIVVINPVTVARSIPIGVAQEADFRVGSINILIIIVEII